MRRNPVVAVLVILGTVVIALSTFTDAARNLLALLDHQDRPPVNGDWEAQVKYDWPNADHRERFTFTGEGNEVLGTAGYLGRARGILEGRVEDGQLHFITRTREVQSPDERTLTVTHHYRGRLDGDRIAFTLQSEGGFTEHVPVSFEARRTR